VLDSWEWPTGTAVVKNAMGHASFVELKRGNFMRLAANL
jgi:hypothetical protein